MLCNMCNKRDAVLLVQKVVFGGKEEMHLCPECAKDRGFDINNTQNTAIENLINSISLPKKVCYICGKSFDDIKKTGMFGCPECYAAFGIEIKNMLKDKGVDTSYTGSMPKKLEHFRSILTDRIEIQKKLDISIEDEDFEKAAMYRDFLKNLERTAISGADEEGDLFDK